MNNNIVIVSAIISSAVIASVAVYFILDSHFAELKVEEEKTYSIKKDNLVIILGSSQTGHLNNTFISQKLPDLNIYNLSIIGDLPIQRKGSIDKIISMHPRLVIYGVGFRDFESNTSVEQSFLSTPNVKMLPDPHDMIVQGLHLEDVGDQNTVFMQNPKGTTMDILHDAVYGNKNNERLDFFNTPFFHPRPVDIQVYDNSNPVQETSNIKQSFRIISSQESNENYKALVSMAHKLKVNGIKVIIFSTPYKKSYLDMVPQKEKESYYKILDYIQQNKDVTYYSLNDRYNDYDYIWTDYNHVALDPTVKVYDDDIISIIRNSTNSP